MFKTSFHLFQEIKEMYLQASSQLTTPVVASSPKAEWRTKVSNNTYLHNIMEEFSLSISQMAINITIRLLFHQDNNHYLDK